MPDTKFHLSLNVSDLEAAVDFYRKTLGVEPAKHFPDYAKFELADPPLVLALEPGRAEGQERLNHFGIRLPSPEGLREIGTRAHTSGLDPQLLQGVECCYSRQTKICLTDPDRNLMEFYFLEEEHGTKSEAKTAPAADTTKVAAFDHLLGQPLALPFPQAEGSLDEVRLRGTFNLKRAPAEVMAILKEARRVLRPGGLLTLHLLASDREVTKTLPRLPGPAALVEHTPVESSIFLALEEAGFTGTMTKRLSHSAVFQFDGAQLRELLVTASRPSEATDAGEKLTVVYKGPFPEVKDELGTHYRRGMRTTVPQSRATWIQASGLEDHFVFLNGETPECRA